MKILKNIALVILVIALFLESFSLITLFTIKHTVSKDSIKDMIVSTDVEKIIKENPELESSLKDSLKEVYDTLEELNINEDIVLKVLNSSEVKGLVGDVTGKVAEYFLEGKDQKLIDADNITSIIGGVMDDINETKLYNFTEKEKNDILDSIKKGIEDNEEFLPDTSILEDTLTEEEQQDLEVVRFIFGGELFTYILIDSLITFGLIVVLSLKKAKWVKITSSTILASGTLMVILMLALLVGTKLIGTEYSYVVDIIKMMPIFGLKVAIVIIILMIAILIIYHLINKHKNITNNN